MKKLYDRLDSKLRNNFLLDLKCQGNHFKGGESLLQHCDDTKEHPAYHQMVKVFLKELYNVKPKKKRKEYQNKCGKKKR